MTSKELRDKVFSLLPYVTDVNGMPLSNVEVDIDSYDYLSRDS